MRGLAGDPAHYVGVLHVHVLPWCRWTWRGFAVAIGLRAVEHEELISNYVSESTALADLHRMLEVEQGDDEEEDLKDLVAEMELDAEEAARFRAAIGAIAEPEPDPEPEPEPEQEPERTDEAWAQLLEALELEPAGTELERAQATIAELRAELAAARAGTKVVPPSS